MKQNRLHQNKQRWLHFIIIIGSAIFIVGSLITPVNPQSSEDPEVLTSPTVRVENSQGFPWGIVSGLIVAAIGIIPQFLKSNVDRIQLQVTAEAQRQKSLEENNQQLFKSFQEQLVSLNQTVDKYRQLENEWRDRYDRLDKDYDALASKKIELEGELQALKIENASLRAKLGIDTSPPRIGADINLRNRDQENKS